MAHKECTYNNCCFLYRIKKDKSEEQLNKITEKIHKEIDKREYNIQFDDYHFVSYLIS